MMAFNQNHKLKNINFPEGLTTIGNYAFSQCFALEVIDLPSTIESLGSLCFEGCSAATTIIVRAATPPTVGFAPLPSWPYDIPIYVPSGSIDVYSNTAVWSNYAGRFEAITYYSPDLEGTIEIFTNEDKNWDN